MPAYGGMVPIGIGFARDKPETQERPSQRAGDVHAIAWLGGGPKKCCSPLHGADDRHGRVESIPSRHVTSQQGYFRRASCGGHSAQALLECVMPRSKRPLRQADRLQEVQRPSAHRGDIAKRTGEGLPAEGGGRMSLAIEMAAFDDLVGGQEPFLVPAGRLDDSAIVTARKWRSRAAVAMPSGLDTGNQAIFGTGTERDIGRQNRHPWDRKMSSPSRT